GSSIEARYMLSYFSAEVWVRTRASAGGWKTTSEVTGELLPVHEARELASPARKGQAFPQNRDGSEMLDRRGVSLQDGTLGDWAMAEMSRRAATFADVGMIHRELMDLIDSMPFY